MRKGRFARRRWTALRRGCVFFSRFLTAAYAFLLIRQPSPFFADDSFFYLQVGRNFALGHGSTFNGLMPTNGYHPLWMLLCAAVYRVFPESHCRAAHDRGADCCAECHRADCCLPASAQAECARMGGVDDSDSFSLRSSTGDGVVVERRSAGGDAAGAVFFSGSSALVERLGFQSSGGLRCAEPAGFHLCGGVRLDCGAGVVCSRAKASRQIRPRCEFIWR